MAEHSNYNQIDAEQQRIEIEWKKHCYSLIPSSILYPISFTRTLMQLGHEPFPLEIGKYYYFFGKKAYYLPNYYNYLNNFYILHGFNAIYTGFGGHIIQAFVGSVSHHIINEVLNRYYPEIGGNIDDLKNIIDLNPYQKFRITLRDGIRKSIQVVLCTVITRPFIVIATRQIAQIIGNETKYLPINPFQPLIVIGSEEGPPGLFSGLMPSIIIGLISVWGMSICTYAVDFTIKKIERECEVTEQNERDALQHVRNALGIALPMLLNTIRYPFEVCAAIMAVTGSGLLVSLLPYSPSFNHWSDAYNYLYPNELKRGGKFFMREEKGSIRVGPDNKLYASKKHFI